MEDSPGHGNEGASRATGGRFSRRLSGLLPILAVAALIATLAAIPVSRDQGRDLIAVLIKAAVFFAAVAVISIAARFSRGFGSGVSKRLETVFAAAEARLTGRRAGLLVAGMMIAYALVWSVLSVLRHLALNSGGYDLAIQHQVILEPGPRARLRGVHRGEELPGRPCLPHHADLCAAALDLG